MIDRRVAVISLALLLPLLLGTVLTVYDAWSDSQRLVVTKDARVVTVTADARSAVAGQVGEHFVHVGDVVREGDVVALVIGPERLRVQVRAPLTGTVLALVAQEGAAVERRGALADHRRPGWAVGGGQLIARGCGAGAARPARGSADQGSARSPGRDGDGGAGARRARFRPA